MAVLFSGTYPAIASSFTPRVTQACADFWEMPARIVSTLDVSTSPIVALMVASLDWICATRLSTFPCASVVSAPTDAWISNSFLADCNC